MKKFMILFSVLALTSAAHAGFDDKDKCEVTEQKGRETERYYIQLKSDNNGESAELVTKFKLFKELDADISRMDWDGKNDFYSIYIRDYKIPGIVTNGDAMLADAQGTLRAQVDVKIGLKRDYRVKIQCPAP